MITTTNKKELITAYTAALMSDGDVEITHVRRYGVTRYKIHGIMTAELSAERRLSAECNESGWSTAKFRMELAKAKKQILKDRKKSLARLKKTSEKTLCY